MTAPEPSKPSRKPIVPRKRQLKPRPPLPRYTLNEREEIVARFDEARRKGIQPHEAANGLGPKLSTIYRWQRTRDPLAGMLPATAAQKHSIDDALEVLADQQEVDRNTFLQALFKLITWMRWPMERQIHPAGIMVCVVSYLSARNPTQTLNDLAPNDLALALNNIHVAALKSACSDDVYLMPSFKLGWYDKNPYTEYDYLAETTRFLLAYAPNSNDHRDTASLAKAYFAMCSGLSRFKMPQSQRTFRKYWRALGAAAGFHYVERYHPNLEFTLDPSSVDFAAMVDEILSRKAELRQYLARCQTATQLLKAKLDRRSVKLLGFPKFPMSLQGEPIEPVALPSSTNVIMRGFVSGQKRWNVKGL